MGEAFHSLPHLVRATWCLAVLCNLKRLPVACLQERMGRLT